MFILILIQMVWKNSRNTSLYNVQQQISFLQECCISFSQVDLRNCSHVWGLTCAIMCTNPHTHRLSITAAKTTDDCEVRGSVLLLSNTESLHKGLLINFKQHHSCLVFCVTCYQSDGRRNRCESAPFTRFLSLPFACCPQRREELETFTEGQCQSVHT